MGVYRRKPGIISEDVQERFVLIRLELPQKHLPRRNELKKKDLEPEARMQLCKRALACGNLTRLAHLVNKISGARLRRKNTLTVYKISQLQKLDKDGLLWELHMVIRLVSEENPRLKNLELAPLVAQKVLRLCYIADLKWNSDHLEELWQCFGHGFRNQLGPNDFLSALPTFEADEVSFDVDPLEHMIKLP